MLDAKHPVPNCVGGICHGLFMARRRKPPSHPQDFAVLIDLDFTEDSVGPDVLDQAGARAALLGQLAEHLQAHGSASMRVRPGGLTARTWRSAARRAARTISRPTISGLHRDGEGAWVVLRDWPATPEEEVIHLAHLAHTKDLEERARLVDQENRSAYAIVPGDKTDMHATREEEPVMAQKVSITLVDDIDGSEADETVTFALDGTTYEIDLNSKHAQALRTELAGYVGYARKVSTQRRSTGRKTSTASGSNGTSAAEIRDWARSNGHEVPERGRIPAAVREAFDAAN
jgi:hypothetical protein